MEKKELYLKPEEIVELRKQWEGAETGYEIFAEYACKASADYAVKRVIEGIADPFEGYVDAFENIRMAKSQGFERFREALKKLAE